VDRREATAKGNGMSSCCNRPREDDRCSTVARKQAW
jgi:hypothetical protein